ncbi:hypothetical protein ZL39_002340 [Salmonella enterica subsp. enterica]|nr:hypothetical protein [Salmonella enterica subsp. enterica serovar Lexington]
MAGLFPAFYKYVDMRNYHLFPVSLLLLSSLLAGCETSACYVGILLTTDREHEKQTLPVAQVGKYYETMVKTTVNWENGPALDPKNLPEGIQMSLLAKNKEGEFISIEHKNVEYMVGDTWIKFSGTPQKAGKFTINVVARLSPSMCGSSDDIWPYVLQIEEAPAP